MATRSWTTPANSELVGIGVSLLARHGANSSDKTWLDQRVQQVLGTDEQSRAAAARMSRTFQSAPSAIRARMFGDLAEPLTATINAERLKFRTLDIDFGVKIRNFGCVLC